LSTGLAALPPHSLHRLLQEEGTSLQQLKDEVQFERAKDLLLRTIKQVAASSGFRNEKSFIRAFHAWAHTSPAEFRKSAWSAIKLTTCQR
jgi:AraC-like DNA-binding protein